MSSALIREATGSLSIGRIKGLFFLNEEYPEVLYSSLQAQIN